MLVYIGTSNAMNYRVVAATTLKTSKNYGGYHLMNIHSGRGMYSHQWDEIPIDDYVIELVESLEDVDE